MEWEKAETASIEPKAHYLVRTNGGEWRDGDLMLMAGPVVVHRLKPEIVRGRPVWVARVTDPDAT